MSLEVLIVDDEVKYDTFGVETTVRVLERISDRLEFYWVDNDPKNYDKKMEEI